MAAVYFALFLYFVERASIRVPVYDLLDWLQFYGDRARADDWLGYLWTPINEHRIVLSRILLAIDVRWFGGAGSAFALSGSILLIAMAVSILREIGKSALLDSWKATAIPVAVFLLVPTSIAVTVGMPIMSVFLHTCAFAVFSLLLLDGANEEGRFSNYRRAAALSAACIASFGVSAGLLIWPVLMWSAWQGNLGWRWLTGIAGVGGLFAALYLPGLHSSGVSIAFSVARLAEMLDYAIRFLGLPWSHMPQLVWPARLVGTGVLCFGGFFIVRESLSGNITTRVQRIGLALVLFVLLTAAAAASARLDIGKDREMPVRYTMFVVLAHVGLLLYLLPYLQWLWQWPYRRSLQWLILGMSLVWVAQQYIVGRFVVREADRYSQAWSRFVAGDWTPDMLHYVYPDRDRARAGLAHLREMQIPHIE